MKRITLSLILLFSVSKANSANISLEELSQLTPSAKKVVRLMIGHLKRKKLDKKTINIKVNQQLKALEESSKYQFHLISSHCSKDSFNYCSRNISEKKLEKINTQGLFFLSTMDCIKRTYKSYSVACKKALKKNKVVN